jgi:Leucine-rich repeat (LRR) protein
MYNKQLKWLTLADNLMFTFPEKDGLYLTQLLFWNISHCNIKNIPLNTFRNIQELQELYLNNNKIVSLNPEVYRPLHRLQKLDLCYNALQNIDGQVFSLPWNIISLSLCHNNISRISITLLNAVVRIGDVNLEGNPWICDCNTTDVYYKCAKADNCNLNLKCAFPDHLKDRHWNATGQLRCMSPVSSTTMGASPEAEAVSTMHEMSTEQILQEDSSEQNISYQIIIFVLFIILLILFAGIAFLWQRICKERKKKDVKETDGESCNSGGFSGTFWENEDRFQQIEIR